MGLTTTGINEALNGIAVDEIRLHSGDPGATGVANPISGATKPAVWATTSNGASRDLDATVTAIAIPQGITVSWWSAWGGGVCKAYDAYTTPEVFANAGSTASVSQAQINLANVV